MPNETNTQDYDLLIDEIKDYLCDNMEENITAMLNTADEELFNLAESADNNEDQTRYFELMKQLRNIRKILAKNFIKKTAEYFKPYGEYKQEPKHTLNENQELSLVAQTDMEDMVLVKSIGTQASSTYRDKLRDLEKRLEDLALKTPTVFDKTALNPINFCQAFNDSLGIIFDLETKKVLFKFFENSIINSLGDVYDELNRMMVVAGILPEIKLSSSVMPQPRQAPQRTNNETPNENAKEPNNLSDNQTINTDVQQPNASTQQQSLNTQNTATDNQPTHANQTQSHANYAMTATPGMSPYTGNIPNNQTIDRSNSNHNSALNTDSNAHNNNPTSGHVSNYSHQVAGMQASQVDTVLTNYFGAPIASGVPSSSDGSTVAAQTSGTNQFLGHNEILTALSEVQQQEEFSEPTELKFDANAVKQAVISSIAKQSGGAVTKRINQIAEKTIDFIEMVFDAIIDDENISDTIKALLLRLQIPVIKASMLDQEFFIYDHHPARVLLDKITEIGIGVNHRENEIYIKVRIIVNKLINEYDLHTSTFEAALNSLNKFIKQRERIAREKEDEEQQKILKEHARETILKTLRSVTKNKRLPESVHALVLRRWPTLLFNHYIDFGKENDAWVHIVEILRDIIESIQPPQDAEALARMQSVRTDLTNLAREYLSRTNQSKKDLDIVITDLEATYDAIESRAKFEAEKIATAAKAISEEEQQEKEQLPEVESTPKQNLPPNIMPGMWFKVYTGEETRPRRCKLSVIIVEDSKLIFVNYAGQIIIEKSFDEFSEEIELYQSKIIMGHSVFDHAFNKVITNMKAA